jgi:hypothetical protein
MGDSYDKFVYQEDEHTLGGALSGRGLRFINIGDEYFKDGVWHTIKTEKEQIEVMRKRYPVKNIVVGHDDQ